MSSDELNAIFDSEEYRAVEREHELWRLRGEFIDQLARAVNVAWDHDGEFYVDSDLVNKARAVLQVPVSPSTSPSKETS